MHGASCLMNLSFLFDKAMFLQYWCVGCEHERKLVCDEPQSYSVISLSDLWCFHVWKQDLKSRLAVNSVRCFLFIWFFFGKYAEIRMKFVISGKISLIYSSTSKVKHLGTCFSASASAQKIPCRTGASGGARTWYRPALVHLPDSLHKCVRKTLAH